MAEADRPLHRFAIATFLFRNVLPDGQGSLPWSQDLLHQVFRDNEFSVRNYWRRSTMSLVDLDFQVVTPSWWAFENFTQAEAQGGGGRHRTIQAARQRLAEEGISIAAFDHLIVAVPNAPTDAGATGQGGDIAFDLAGASLPFLQHEVGHTLGFQHAFGPYQDGDFGSLYNDGFDVMGFTGMNAHSFPRPVRFPSPPPNDMWFWQSERRLSAASLYRHSESFRSTTGTVHVTLDPFGRARATIAPLTAVANPHPGRVAVISLPVRPGLLTVEYRVSEADDAGFPGSGVVIHSIGVNDVGPGRSERDPAWLEKVIDPIPGQAFTLAGSGLRAQVANVANDGMWVEVEFARVPTP